MITCFEYFEGSPASLDFRETEGNVGLKIQVRTVGSLIIGVVNITSQPQIEPVSRRSAKMQKI